MEIAVIGAGVMGLCGAHALVRRRPDCRVTVHERAPRLGAEACSRFAGGMLAPWCEGDTAEPVVTRLGREALDYWSTVEASTTRQGSLVVAPGRDRPELARFARRTHGGVEVDAEEIAALEPDLAGRFPRGLHFPDEAHLDPRAALDSLAARLREAGVAIRLESEVTAEELEADAVLDARGLAARDRLADLRGVKGEMLILRTPDVRLHRPVRLLHPRFPLYVVPRGEGVFMVGATQIESGDRFRVTARSMVELLNAAYALHPAFAEAEILEMGADARPAFVDNLPRLRREGRVLFANGLFRHGFLLAPVLADRAAGVLLDDDSCPEVLA